MPRHTRLDPIDVEELRILLVPHPGVDQHEPIGMLDEQAAHPERDPIPFVRRDAALPKRLRHDAEHRTAVEALAAGLESMDPPGTELAGFVEGSRSGHGAEG